MKGIDTMYRWLINYSKYILFLCLIFLFSQNALTYESWWKLYFTKSKEVNPKVGLISLILKSKKSLNFALCIDVVGDNRGGLMHNKFVISDNEYLWTGSYNVTENGSQKNNNNSILIKSLDLCKIFQYQFNQMFDDKIFGNRYEPGPFYFFRKKRNVFFENSKVEVLFSPQDNVIKKIIDLINGAKISINLMGFSFTEDNISESLINQHLKGVDVKVLIESRGAGTEYSEFTKLKLEGVSVRKDKNRYAMHHKVIVIDNKITIMGSFNFSKGAQEKNDENTLIIHNRDISKRYEREFFRLFGS